MNEEKFPSLEIVYSEVKDSLNGQFQSVISLDTKASIIIGFVGIIMGTVLGLDKYNNATLFIISIVFFGGSIFLSIFAYRTEAYRSDPEPRKLTERYLAEECEIVKKQIIDNFIQSYEANKIRIQEKAKHINHSLYLLFIGFIFLTLSIIGK